MGWNHSKKGKRAGEEGDGVALTAAVLEVLSGFYGHERVGGPGKVEEWMMVREYWMAGRETSGLA